jgi:FHA domain
MPKLSLLLGRKTMQVFDLDQPSIVVGRDESADILIDNPSMSRRHAELRQEGAGWVVEDLGSSNGTFIGGERIDGPRPIEVGSEIGFGKFSVVFGKAVGDEAPAPAAAAAPASRPTMAAVEGTMHIKAHEVKELLKDSERKRRAHLVWEAGGQRGQHFLSEAPAALFGTDDLCDVRVPKGPGHHLLIMNTDKGCDVRWLAAFGSIKVNGSSTKKASLKDGDVVEAKGLKLTFVGDIS